MTTNNFGEVFVQQPATREEWLEERRRSIGGSDAPSLYNCGFLSQLELQLDKLNQLGPRQASLAMRIGLVAESEIAAEAERHTGMASVGVEPQGIWRRTGLPFMHATPDRFLLTERPQRIRIKTLAKRAQAVLSLKMRHPATMPQWSEYPPLDVMIQLQHEMIVTGCHVGYVTVVFGNGSASQTFGPYNLLKSFEETHPKRCELWWQAHVIQGAPVTGALVQSDFYALNQAFPKSDPKLAIALDESWTRVVKRYRQAKRLVKKLQEIEEESAAQIKMHMGSAEYAVLDDETSISWRSQTRNLPPRLEAKTIETRPFRIVKTPKELQQAALTDGGKVLLESLTEEVADDSTTEEDS